MRGDKASRIKRRALAKQLREAKARRREDAALCLVNHGGLTEAAAIADTASVTLEDWINTDPEFQGMMAKHRRERDAEVDRRFRR
ncbi:MAG: hypothetical protein GY937_23040 [bacterium]|nr:hypothetical protein [bacterium]